ncbi:MAG: PhoH family protein [Pseudomonadota bacterium]
MRVQSAPPGDAEAKAIVVFENNRVASDVVGQFDQHLALIEQRLHVIAVARGNQVTLSGTIDAVDRATAALETLEDRAESGQPITLGDVDGALRLAPETTPRSAEFKPKSGAASIETRKRLIAARTPNQEAFIRALVENELVFANGPAGTGKTYLAVAHAASLLERGNVDRIVLSRPAVEAGERLGFLPGDMKEKVDPYLRPLYDALYDVMAADRVERDIQSGVIEIAPLAFMRGRTLANAAVILDEAQNTTSMQMKMFLTRLGENSRMIVTGDPSQIDLPPGQTSGLKEALKLLSGIDGISEITFTAADVVRHPLVAKIVSAYEKRGQRRNGAVPVLDDTTDADAAEDMNTTPEDV